MNPCAGSAIRKKINSDITLDVAISFIFMFLKLLSLKQAADNFLGVLLGVILAAVRVYLFVALVNLLLPYGTQLGWTFFSQLDAGSTILFSWFCEHNLFTVFFG